MVTKFLPVATKIIGFSIYMPGKSVGPTIIKKKLFGLEWPEAISETILWEERQDGLYWFRLIRALF